MKKSDQPSPKTHILRWTVAGALGLGLAAGPLLGAYAAPGDPTPTAVPGVSPATTTTTNPVATAMPAPTTAPNTTTSKPTANPTAAASPTMLNATYDTRPFTCDLGLCDHSNITAYVPNAPDTAWIGIQWLDSNGPTWRNVEGWQGNLDIAPNTGQPFKQWTVFKTNFNQGPFRWVIQTSQDGPIWGISPTFNLPALGGVNVLTFLTQPAGAPAAQMPATTNNTSLTGAPMLNTSSITTPFGCASPCDESNIAIYVPNAPSTAWVGIQWMDSNGGWHDVPGWQGSLDMATDSTTPFKQWTVFHSQLGAGPFHWVIYTQKGGSVWGVSPNFNLPRNGGELLSTFVSSAG